MAPISQAIDQVLVIFRMVDPKLVGSPQVLENLRKLLIQAITISNVRVESKPRVFAPITSAGSCRCQIEFARLPNQLDDTRSMINSLNERDPSHFADFRGLVEITKQ